MTSGNALLSSLPPEELERISVYLRRVELRQGQLLFAAGEPLTHLWFPENGAVARLIQLRSGETIEVGILGNDSMVGLTAPSLVGVANGQCLSLLNASALTLSLSDYFSLQDGVRTPLHDVITREAGIAIARLAQIAACHALHRLEQRLARCVLTIEDYAGEPLLPITHDTLASFLGVHRPSVTYALQGLAQNGAIELERRRIIIADREALMASCCECYLSIKKLAAGAGAQATP